MATQRGIVPFAAIAFMSLLSSEMVKADQSIQYRDQNIPPKIVRVGAVLFNDVLYVVGKVEDPDDNPSGQIVQIRGSVEGTTEIRADGMFYFSIPYTYPFGVITVRTFDRRGAQSYTEVREFAE